MADPDNPVLRSFPDWTPETIKRLAHMYWTGKASPEPMWEVLSARAVVVKVLSLMPIPVRRTEGGWPKPRRAGNTEPNGSPVDVAAAILGRE